MRTRTLSSLLFVKTPRSSVNTALGLLVIGTIVSSLILVSFHYKSEYLLKQSDDREQNYEFGPPGTGENGSVADSSFRRGNAAKAGMISASVSASGSPRKGAINNDNNNDYTVETDTTNTVSATLRTAGSSSNNNNNKGGSHLANAKASVEHNGCLLNLNSRSWLENKRLGNQNISDSRIINNDYVAASILNIPLLLSDDEANSQSILKRTLCDKTSRFLTFKFSTTSLRDPNGRSHHHTEEEGFSATETTTTTHIASNTSNSNSNTSNRHRHHHHHHRTLLHQLALRLTYLSVHAHQHKDAIREAEYRRKHSEVCDPELEAHRIGAFDFECPDARFLVVPMKRSGLGGQARLIAAVALMAGISSDRVVVFVNGSPVGPRFLREPWELSSCPRRDKQCFFLPDTPCVLTHDEIRNATTIGKAERRGLFKTGMLPEHLRDDRVLIMNMIDRPQREPPNFRRRIADAARKFLIDPLAGEHPNDPRLPLLSAAADHIVENDDNENDEKSIVDSFYYFGRNFRALHAMVFFALRPKLEYADRIDWILENTLESNHRSDLSLGLPIRASDKCIIESECPPFETYVSLVQTVWDTHEKELGDAFRKRLGGGGTMPDSTTVVDPPLLQHTTNIILTSESPDVLEAQKAFQEQQSSGHHDEKKNLSFPFKFVTNRFDVLPNTGNPSELSDFEHDREEVLLSALASLKLQFHAKYTVGNCCSNHHLLLFDFLTGGCGAGNMDHHATCMQDHEDARFRLCCAWTKTEECLAKRSRRESLQSQQQQQQQNTTVPP